MNQQKPQRWVSSNSAETSLRASSGLVNAVSQNVGMLDGVSEIRVLHRDPRLSKFFVVLAKPSLEIVERVVDAMVQIENAFPGQRFDYDTVPADGLPLVPVDAMPVGHG